MPYVRRDPSGRIVALLREMTPDAQEHLPAGHPEVAAFLDDGLEDEATRYLSESDLELARVLEDLIQLLMDKRLILFTELPPFARDKLSARRRAREHIHDGPTLGDASDSIL